MQDTYDRFLLSLHNLAFGEDPELNGTIWFVAISVSRQSVSWYRVLNVRTCCISIHLIFSKASIVDFNGWWGIWFCPFILWVQDLGWCWDQWRFAPLWLLGARDLILDSWFDHWLIWWCYSSSVVVSEDYSRRSLIMECFCSICCCVSTEQPISRFEIWSSSDLVQLNPCF